MDFESIPNTNLFCEKDSLLQIARRLGKRRPSNITFIGSGNYHYISFLFLSEIKHPFTLVLFDHHTDTLPSPSESLISCGSWVLESLQNLPMLKKVIIIGASEDSLQHIPSSINDKIFTFTENELRTNYTKNIQSIIRNIPTESVYISIDKDVLDTKEAVTAWDQGRMQLKQLMYIVKKINQFILNSVLCWLGYDRKSAKLVNA